VSKPVVKLIQPPIQCLPGALYPKEKGMGLEADNTPPASAEIKNDGSIPTLPIRLHGLVLNYIVKYRDNISLYFIFILQFPTFLLLFSSPYISYESMTYMELFQTHAKSCPTTIPQSRRLSEAGEDGRHFT
jgi:hypothetical protein